MQQLITTITSLASPAGFVHIIRFFLAVIVVVYALYAFIMFRQVGLMHKSFATPAGIGFKLTVFVHFAASVVIAFFVIITA